jgi:PAS domain S-box-containing protein
VLPRRPRGRGLPTRAHRARLRLIPFLLAVTWLAVASVRIEQLTRSDATSSDLAQVWAVGALTALALLYLVYAAIRRRTTTQRALDRAFRSVTRLEQITDVQLSDLPTDELLSTLIQRVCDGLGADAGMLMLSAEDGGLEVRATWGLATQVPDGFHVAPGVGLAGRVAHRRAAMALDDLSSDTFAVHPIRDVLASAAGAPLLVDGRVSGVLVIASTAPHSYDDEDMKLLQLAAERSARAIEGNRLREAERRLNLGTEHARRHLRLLVDASRIFQETVADYEAGLVRLVELASRDFAGFGAVYLAEGGESLGLLVAQHPDGGESVRAFRGLPSDALGPVRESMATGRSRLSKDTGGDLFGRAVAAMGVTSYIVVPITVRGLAFGAFVFGTTGEMRGFRPSDQSAAEELGRRAALAVEASLLYREAHDSAELAESYAGRLRNLLNAWLSISVALERPDGLQAAADGACRVLDGEQAHLWVGDAVTTARASGARAPSAATWTWLRSLGRPVRGDMLDVSALPADVAAELGPSGLVGAGWICAPLRDPAARVDGLLLVTGQSSFTAEDESLLLLLAQMVAAALANSALHRVTRENETRLTALIESSPVAIVDLSLDTSIRSWNPAAARLFDWPADASSGWAAAFDPRMADWVRTLASEAATDGEPAQLECEFTRDDGQEKALVLAVSPVHDQHGVVTGLLLVADDETERRQLARQFTEAQRLDAVGRMAGGVAHDFNNLLTVILGYADGLLRRMDEDNPNRERIAAISRAGHRGAALTRQLLAVSRRQVVAPIVLRPVDVFHEMAEMVGRLIGEDIRVHVVASPDERPVRIDKAQFEQVLLNLAANARDAMREGGDLYLEVVESLEPDYVTVRVRDTGHGMDEETLAHCLEPFYTTKDRGEGTGLGMAAVYGIITQSGGEVVVQSRVGLGTTVTLLLPAVDAPLDYAPAVSLPTPASATQQQSGTILLVEDEGELRSMVRRMLRERGYVVLQASSAKAALGLLSEYDGQLDLMITDVVMPGMKGPELARRVALERDVPVLFVSGYAEELSDMPSDFDAPTSFLAKPFTPEQLLDEVYKLIAVARARPPIADDGRSSDSEPQLTKPADRP